MGEITDQLRRGLPDPSEGRAFYDWLYEQLHRLAGNRRSRLGSLLPMDATELVHESFPAVQQALSRSQSFADRDQFLRYASRLVRNVAVSVVRADRAQFRGGGQDHTALDSRFAEMASPDLHDEMIEVDAALARLEKESPRLAQVVEMRYFMGWTEAEIAHALGMTERTVQRDWAKARLFLRLALRGESAGSA